MDETTTESKDLAEKIARELSGLVQVNLDSKLSNLMELLDDMLTRLEETENLLNIAEKSCQLNSDNTTLEAICDHHLQNLSSICAKIDTIENFVQTRKKQVMNAKQRLETAQTVIGNQPGTFQRIFKPLFTP